MSPTLSTATAAAPATLESWSYDPAHSSIGFRVRHLVVAKVHGRFTRWTGNLELGGEDLTGSRIEVSIEAASIDTHDPQRDAHLRSADFFDVANNPKLSFKSTAIKASGKDSYQVAGDLTMRGVTRPVTLNVAFLGEGKDPWGNEKMGFDVSGTLNRKDFNINWNKALDNGGVLVADEVKVQIAVEANKAKPPAGK